MSYSTKTSHPLAIKNRYNSDLPHPIKKSYSANTPHPQANKKSYSATQPPNALAPKPPTPSCGAGPSQSANSRSMLYHGACYILGAHNILCLYYGMERVADFSGR